MTSYFIDFPKRHDKSVRFRSKWKFENRSATERSVIGILPCNQAMNIEKCSK
jgi:hypothetical protein